jgi:LysM repeat protein
MPETVKPTGDLIKQKWGPLPVWGWGLAVLAIAWGYSKYKSNKSAQASATSDQASVTPPTDSGESEATAPQFIIENNQPSYPIATPVGPSTPVVTPPTTTPAPPTTTTPPPTTKPTTPAKPVAKAPIKYVVKSGDNLSTIAAKYKTTAAKLFTYNTTPGVRPASTIATLKSRGPNLIYAGETILIPQS